MKIKADYSNAPQWKEVSIKSTLPEQLKCLDEIAHNMWWAWNYEARDMWESLDAKLYEEVGRNPVLLLERLSYERKEAIVKDKTIMKRVKDVYKMFRAYMDVKPNKKRASVAYFCMEYGINQVLKIYSGGLGMLAGDYVKEASDSNVDMCAIGFLYRYGYFKQSLSMDGQQIANYDAQNFNSLPIERVLDKNGNPVVVDVPYMNYQVHAYVWQVNVGRVKLYLLLSVCATTLRTASPSTRPWSWYAPLLFTPSTLPFPPVTTTSTRLSSASTWVAILSSSASLGTSSSAWAVRTPMTTASVSACQPSLATPARRLTA